MFTIVKNNKKTKTTFYTYESARQALRKKLRKLTALRRSGQPWVSMKDFGYQIRQVV